MIRCARLLALALCVVLACRSAPEAEAPDARVLAIADTYVADVFEERPGSVARLRVPGARYDGLPDHSLAGVAATEERRAAWLAELRGVERGALATSRAPARLRSRAGELVGNLGANGGAVAGKDEEPDTTEDREPMHGILPWTLEPMKTPTW